MDKKYTVNGKDFIFGLTLEQDELLGFISYEMIKEQPATLAKAQNGMIAASSKEQTVQQKMSAIVEVALDMIKVNAWIYMKGYSRRILAICLVPDGEEFQSENVGELEKFFAKYASRDTANEVINLFFQRSGAFGIGTQAFLPATSTK